MGRRVDEVRRTIKSFVLRTGRVSNRQQYALDNWLLDYELPLDDKLWDLSAIFARHADTIVEIGFGMGASLFAMAKAAPELNFIGIEVHRAGLGSLAADLHDEGLKNVRLVPHDAVQVFKQQLPLESLSGIQVFFPDPWHKKKHHKRRLIQAGFVDILVSRLKPGGFIHTATDWEDYALQMQDVFKANKNLANSEAGDGFAQSTRRPNTRFEARGRRLGHGVWDLIYYKKD